MMMSSFLLAYACRALAYSICRPGRLLGYIIYLSYVTAFLVMECLLQRHPLRRPDFLLAFCT